MLGWLPPLRLLIGFRSPNRLLLFRGLTMVLDEAERSSKAEELLAMKKADLPDALVPELTKLTAT